jgi:hypothetical protein
MYQSSFKNSLLQADPKFIDRLKIDDVAGMIKSKKNLSTL